MPAENFCSKEQLIMECPSKSFTKKPSHGLDHFILFSECFTGLKDDPDTKDDSEEQS